MREREREKGGQEIDGFLGVLEGVIEHAELFRAPPSKFSPLGAQGELVIT